MLHQDLSFFPSDCESFLNCFFRSAKIYRIICSLIQPNRGKTQQFFMMRPNQPLIKFQLGLFPGRHLTPSFFHLYLQNSTVLSEWEA